MKNKWKISMLITWTLFTGNLAIDVEATQVNTTSTAQATPQVENLFKVPIKSGVVTNEFGGYDALGTGHTGIDLANDKGTPVYASADGTVISSTSNDVSGNKVEVLHYLNGKYYVTYYGHLDSRNVSVGDQVTTSTEVGKMGDSGLATGPHVHFEIMEGTTVSNHNLAVNPRKYLNLPSLYGSFVEDENKVEYSYSNGYVKTGYKYSDSKLTNVYEYYPATKADGNQNNHVKFEFLLDENANIISATKYADGTNQIVAHYKYYPATKYAETGSHGKQIKYRYDVDENGYLKRAYLYADGTHQKIQKYWYAENTIYGQHANQVVKTYNY